MDRNLSYNQSNFNEKKENEEIMQKVISFGHIKFFLFKKRTAISMEVKIY